MKTYCVKCKTNTENIDPKLFRTKKNRLLMQSSCSDCKNKKITICKRTRSKGIIE